MIHRRKNFLIMISKSFDIPVFTYTRRFFMNGKLKSKEATLSVKQIRIKTQNRRYKEAIVQLEILARLPIYGPKPLCRFTHNGMTFIGRFESTKNDFVYIRHKYGKRVVRYTIKELESFAVISI